MEEGSALLADHGSPVELWGGSAKQEHLYSKHCHPLNWGGGLCKTRTFV